MKMYKYSDQDENVLKYILILNVQQSSIFVSMMCSLFSKDLHSELIFKKI